MPVGIFLTYKIRMAVQIDFSREYSCSRHTYHMRLYKKTELTAINKFIPLLFRQRATIFTFWCLKMTSYKSAVTNLFFYHTDWCHVRQLFPVSVTCIKKKPIKTVINVFILSLRPSTKWFTARFRSRLRSRSWLWAWLTALSLGTAALNVYLTYTAVDDF